MNDTPRGLAQSECFHKCVVLPLRGLIYHMHVFLYESAEKVLSYACLNCASYKCNKRGGHKRSIEDADMLDPKLLVRDYNTF